MPKTIIMGCAIILLMLLPFSIFAQTQEIKDYKVIKGDTLRDISDAALKSTSASRESDFAADQRDKGIEKEIAPKPASSSACQETAVVNEQRYQEIKGIVLYDGTVIEGQIISMNAETVKICVRDGTVMSYSFEREVANFIRE